MTTRQRNIYSIGRPWGVACLLGACVLLAIGVSPAGAQCRDEGGAGDQYCEGIPAPGGRQGAPRPPGAGGGIPASTGRALDHARAGAVRLVQSPRRGGRRAAKGSASSSPKLTGTADGTADAADASALPYILGALSLVLVLTALLVRRRRGAGARSEDAG